MLKLGAAGEDDDHFLHDGRTRSTSIPFNLGGDFEPVPQEIIAMHARAHEFARFPSRFYFASRMNLARNCAQFPEGAISARWEFNLQNFARCRIINCLF